MTSWKTTPDFLKNQNKPKTIELCGFKEKLYRLKFFQFKNSFLVDFFDKVIQFEEMGN